MPVRSGQVCPQSQVSCPNFPGWGASPESDEEQLQPLGQTSSPVWEGAGDQGQKGPVAKTSSPTEMGLWSLGKSFHRVLNLSNLGRV